MHVCYKARGALVEDPWVFAGPFSKASGTRATVGLELARFRLLSPLGVFVRFLVLMEDREGGCFRITSANGKITEA